MGRTLFIAAGCLALVGAGCGSTGVRIAWPADAAQRAPVVVEGLAPEVLRELGESVGSPSTLHRTFAVFAGSEGTAPPVSGDFAVREGALLFTPRYGWTENLAYRAVLHVPGSAGGRPIEREHTFHAPPLEPSARVLAVYPSAARLPHNLLRLYIHFSASMRRGEAYEHVHVLDEQGRALAEPFLPIPQELWNAETTRLTLLFDPGRIKRGLVPHEEFGAPLQPNRSYRLRIDAGWRDARGTILAEPFERSLQTVGPDRASPTLASWRLTAPEQGTRAALRVEFPEPLDRALLARMLTVQREDGAQVAGNVSIDREETRWSFVPSTPWLLGTYRLEVDPRLEDVAGNSLMRPFEVVTSVPDVEKEVASTLFQMRFEVGS